MTYYSILAIFPALAALVAIYGFFSDPNSIAKHLDEISGFVPGGAIDIAREQLTRVATKGDRTLGLTFVLGLGISLWSANAAMKSFRHAEHRIRRAGKARLREAQLDFAIVHRRRHRVRPDCAGRGGGGAGHPRLRVAFEHRRARHPLGEVARGAGFITLGMYHEVPISNRYNGKHMLRGSARNRGRSRCRRWSWPDRSWGDGRSGSPRPRPRSNYRNQGARARTTRYNSH
jgi:hypothetical protein